MKLKIVRIGDFRHLGLLLVCLLVAFSGVNRVAAGDLPTPGDAYLLARPTGTPELQTPAPTGRIVLHFAAASDLVMTVTGVRARTSDKTGRARRIIRRVAELVPGAQLEKRFPGADARLGKTYRPSPDRPDLALYAHLDAGTRDRDTLLRLLAALNAEPDIDLAFLEPVVVPAALGFDAFTGAVPTPLSAIHTAAASSRDTPDFESQQGYLADAPDGIGAWSMRTQPGARGAGVTVVDVEGAWLWSHEDLPSPVVDMGDHYANDAWRYHGTAVAGEIRGTDNGLGVTGIVPDCAVGNSSIFPTSSAQALAAAMDTLSAGDLILIELHGPGPNANGNGQFGYVPLEWWQDNFDVIRLATAKGILVIEAAGNGYQNLDDAIYQDLFDRSVRDSGAIMCGATAGSTTAWADFSNHGLRVDLNGWGWDVVTCAYGDLQGEPLPEEQWYTAEFSGTSSASPIVTGAVAGLQGMVRARHGFDLDARLARDLLLATGTSTQVGRWIGRRPDLVSAYALADTGIGELSGTLREFGTGLPVTGALVKIVDQDGPVDGAFTLSAEDGHWRLPLQTGPVTLAVSHFYYQTAYRSATIASGQQTVLDANLIPLTLIDITGTVYGDGRRLAGARIAPLDHPIASTVSDADGNWTLSGVPALYDYRLLIDGVPGFGARALSVATATASEAIVVNPILTAIGMDFESNGGGFTSSNGAWTHGLPPVEVTGGAFSGDACWGVGMSGSYDNDTYDALLSPLYDLSGVTADDLLLSFHYLCATEPGYDGVTVEISTGGAFETLEPVGGYPTLTLFGLNSSPGWSGQSDGWQGAVFNLTPYLGQPVVFLQFIFGSDGALAAQGFYIDGLAFGPGLSVSAIDSDTPSPPVVRLTARPNPFNPNVQLDYDLTRPAHLDVRVYDLRGRHVRTLLAAPVGQTGGSLVWNGKTDAGRTAPSGVYLIRLRSSAGDHAVRRVVLAK